MSYPPSNKYNYIEIVNKGVPEYYRESDYRLYGSEEDISLTFLGKILKAAIQNDLLFTVSGKDKFEVAEYFVPEQKTNITPNSFQSKILAPYGLTFDSFTSQDEFTTWFSGTFLPDAILNNPRGFYTQISGYGFDNYSSLALTHEYLLDNLGIFYIMNTSSLEGATASSFASALMCEYFVNDLYAGKQVTEQQGITVLFRYFWENRESSTFAKSFLPAGLVSSTGDLSSNPYLSGTQVFDAIQLQLRTWTDKRLKDHSFFKASLSGLLAQNSDFPTKLRDAGPFQRFLKAVSLGIADVNLILEELSDLLSIDECPEQFLELLANNVGWKFLTGDYSKWRAQLRNAVLLYKTKGSVVGLDAACKLVFPDGIFDASDVVETWESYLPKLLYYMIKNSSFIKKEGLEFENKETLFGNSWPVGVRFNQAPVSYNKAKDRNYRFLVDAILEHFHNTFRGILIHGQDFRELPMWTCLPGVGNDKGFSHRNYPQDVDGVGTFKVAVPPWEKYGFYTECELNPERLDFFCEILSGSRTNFGFEVDEYIVSGFRNLVSNALSTVYSLTGKAALGNNNKFRLFTSGHELPPDYSNLVTYGNTTSLQDLDTWNTKGAHLFAVFEASSLEYTLDAYDTFRNKAALEAFRDVLKDFVPLHAVVRVILYNDLEDSYIPSGTLCIFSDECVDDFNTGYLNSKRSAFWVGASGLGNLSTTYINGDGRILPSYDPAENEWWQVSDTDLDRNSSRRRDYRYALDCFTYVRSGKGMPLALNHYDMSSPYMNNSEYILKGFRYDRQDFLPTSSVVWDNSGFYSNVGCDAGEKTSQEYQLSSLFPVRAVPETDFECSSLPVYRDTMKGVLEVMTTYSLLKDKFFDFSDLNYRSYEFGNSVHEAYSIYKNEFSSVLKNTLSPSTPYYGGLNFISYAYGPSIWNSDFRYKGKIVENTGSLSGPSVPGVPTTLIKFGYEPQWQYVFGGTNSAGLKYQNYGGRAVTISDRPFIKSAANTTPSDLESGVDRSRNLLTTREALSGIEIHQPYPESESFVVVNDTQRATYNSLLKNSVTLFNTDGKPLEVVIPLDPSIATGSYRATLRPQSQQKAYVVAKTKANRKTQVIKITLSTSGVQDDLGNVVDWFFSWSDNKWKPSTMGIGEEFIKRISIPKLKMCPTFFEISFHTQDSLSLKEIPCLSAIKEGQLHAADTKYLLKISNETVTTPAQGNSLVNDAIDIFEVSIIDTVLNEKIIQYDQYSLDRIYTFWDTLSHGKHSRNAVDSSGYFEVSGGSRAEYVELIGGDDFSTSSTITVGATQYDFIEFEVED